MIKPTVFALGLETQKNSLKVILIRLMHQILNPGKEPGIYKSVYSNLVNEQAYLYITDKHTTSRFKLIYIFGLYFITIL